MRGSGYRRSRPSSAWLLGLSLLVLLPLGCGNESETDGGSHVAKGENGRIGHIERRPGEQNPVIVGEDLTKLPGVAGEVMRKRARQRALDRENNPWVQPVDIDLGSHRLGKVVKGTFEITNPRDRDHRITKFGSSCSCQRMVLVLGEQRIEIAKGRREPITIPAGAKAKLEIFVEIQRLAIRTTSVMLDLDDPELPFLTLTAKTQGVMDFVVEHEGRQIQDLYLGQFGVHDSKEFEVRVTARNGKPFEIEKVFELEKGFEASYEQVAEEPGAWRVYGRVGPNLEEGSFSRSVRLGTKDERQIEFRLTGIVLPPYRISPSYLNFGRVKPGEAEELPVRIESLEAGLSVEVASVRWLHATLKQSGKGEAPLDPESCLGLEIAKDEQGRATKVLVRVRENAPQGRIKAQALVSFTSGQLRPKQLRVVAIVR